MIQFLQDLTEKLNEDGIARLEIKNESLNVHWILHLMSNSVKEVLGEEEVFKQAEKIWESGAKLANISHSMETTGDGTVFNYLSVGLGILFVVIGVFGLYFKIKEKNTKRASKLVKSSISVWCCIVGTLLTISEISYTAGYLNNSVESMMGLAIRVSVFALKHHTVIVFTFQNILIYYPFYFKERKKHLAKLLVRLTIGQWAISICFPLIFALFFILSGWKYCTLIFNVSFAWQSIYQGLLVLGYLGSFISSIIYMIGFYKEHSTNIITSTSRQRSIKQTMVACSIEIVCDLAALSYHVFFNTSCSLTLRKFEHEAAINLSSRNVCDASVRISLLNPGVAKCVLFALLVQQFVQETIFLIAVVVDKSQK